MAWPVTVRKSDLNIVFYKSSGPGGQNKNKRDTACRMTHEPTGTVVRAEDERTQGRNQKLAFRRLSEKLVPMMVAAAKRTPESEPVTARIRTYHAPRGTVSDTRVPGEKWNYTAVLKGDVDEIMTAVRKSLN